MKSRIFLAVIIFCVGLALGINLNAPGPSVVSKEISPRRYVFNAAFASIPFWREPRSIWLELSNPGTGVKTEFSGPVSGDAAKQIEEIEGLIAQQVDGIAIFPGDPKALAPVINKAVAQGIPVVTAFADVSDSKRLSAVRALEGNSARQMMERLLVDFPQLTQEKSKIIISIANPAIDTQRERLNGISEIVSLNPQLEIAAVVNDEIDETKGAEAIHAALTQHPDIKAIIGTDSRSAIGALSALRELGKKPGEVIVTGWDSDVDVLNGIKKGWIHSTVVIPGNFMMELSFALLEAYYLGADTPGALERNIRDIPDHIDVPSKVVNMGNVDAYLK